MAFLDNSGDIILDAVLTDSGRKALAAADGSFNIKFIAFGDDEIDYGLYDNTKTNSSLKDLQIMKTPIFESITNNTSALNSYLITYNSNNILNLPILKVNDRSTDNSAGSGFPYASAVYNNSTPYQYVVLVDETTEHKYTKNRSDGVTTLPDGFIVGYTAQNAANRKIVISQGVDNNQLPPSVALSGQLITTEVRVEMDNRFGTLVSPAAVAAQANFISTDNIATYIAGGVQVKGDKGPGWFKSAFSTKEGGDVIAGPRSHALQFSIMSSANLMGSTYLFTTIGTEDSDYFPAQKGAGSQAAYYIDTVVDITSVKTGYRIMVPIRYVKAQ